MDRHSPQLSFEDANAAQSGVVFNQTNTTVTAQYKGHLLTTSTTGTATNNQRKMGESEQGVFCLVYESGNRIWFSRSSDAVNWSQDIPISDQSSGNANAYPSIVVKNNMVNVVWQSIDWWGPPFYGNVYIPPRVAGKGILTNVY